MKSRGKLKAVIDRIEDDLAVLVLDDDGRVKFNLPVKYLPEGARGGDHLDMAFTLDKRSRQAELKKANDLLAELTGEKRDDKKEDKKGENE